MEAELRKKKRSNQGQTKSYAYRRVLNGETIKEREGFVLLKEHWKWIARTQPNLLIPLKRKKKTSLAKKPSLPTKMGAIATGTAAAARISELLLTPSVAKLFSPEKGKAPAPIAPNKSPSKAPTQRKAQVASTILPTTVMAIGRAVGLGLTQGTAQHQEVEQPFRTRSGRVSVKRVVFEAGKN